MKLLLETKRERERAEKLARSMLKNLNQAIKDGEKLQALFNRAHDFGMQNTLSAYTGYLEETRECDKGEAGLRPLLRELLAAIKKGR